MIHRRIRGFTLIEILVALVLLSLGLLGVAKLVLTSAKGNDSAYMRSQAVQLAYSILDAMRANRAQAAAGSYTMSSLTATCPPAPTAPSPLCDAAACTAAQMATWDIYQWQVRICAALPSGQGQIVTSTSGSYTTATITVQWDDSRAQSGLSQAVSGTASSANTVAFTLGTSL